MLAKNDLLTVGWVGCKFTFDVPALSGTLGTSFFLHQLWNKSFRAIVGQWVYVTAFRKFRTDVKAEPLMFLAWAPRINALYSISEQYLHKTLVTFPSSSYIKVRLKGLLFKSSHIHTLHTLLVAVSHVLINYFSNSNAFLCKKK